MDGQEVANLRFIFNQDNQILGAIIDGWINVFTVMLARDMPGIATEVSKTYKDNEEIINVKVVPITQEFVKYLGKLLPPVPFSYSIGR